MLFKAPLPGLIQRRLGPHTNSKHAVRGDDVLLTTQHEEAARKDVGLYDPHLGSRLPSRMSYHPIDFLKSPDLWLDLPNIYALESLLL